MHEDREAMRPLLIAGVTGRALARSARRGGYPAVVLDYFADQDTRASAYRARAVVSPRALRFDRSLLLESAETLAPAAGSSGLIYSSGFEGQLGLLHSLAQDRQLLGNRVDVVRAVKAPSRFFPLLDRLGISHPEVRQHIGLRETGRLAKRTGGAGGTHVRPATPGRCPPGTYVQRRAPGDPCSVLFLANGHEAMVLGWNRQWTRPVPGAPYLFGGAVGGVRMPSRVSREVSAAVSSIVRATGLVGLNGVDFLLDGDRWSLLEVNPRPPATIELYDADYPTGLVHWHLEACAGRLPLRARRSRAARALSIVQAPVAWVKGDEPLPAWCRDRPVPGTAFAPGDPVCTVHGSAPSSREARALVEARRRRMESWIARQRRGAVA